MTPVAPTGSISVNGGLPSHPPGAGVALRHRAGMPRIPCASAVATGVHVPRLQGNRGVVYRAPALDVRGLWPPGFGNGGHDLPRHTYAVDALVPRHLVGGQPEERRQRTGPATNPWTGQLPHGLDVAPQAPTCHGSARPGPAVRDGRGGRDLRRRCRGRRRAPTRWEQGAGGHRRRGARACSRPNPHAPGGGFLGRKLAAVCAGSRSAWRRGHHRRAAELPRPSRLRLSPRSQNPPWQWGIGTGCAASCAPGRLTSQALAPRHSSGCGQP